MLRLTLVIVCLTALTACGLKGPLYLPDSTNTPAQSNTPTEQSVPASPLAQ